MFLPNRRIAGAFLFLLLAFLLETQAQEAPPILKSFPGHTDTVYSVRFSPDGKLLATGSFDTNVRLFDVATGKEVRVFGGTQGHQKLVLSVAFSPKGDLLASGGSDNNARLWDVPLKKSLREFAHASPVQAVSLSPDGKLLAGACKDGSIKLWSQIDGKQLFNLPGHPGGATGVAFNSGGQILLSIGADQNLRAWNTANGQPVGSVGVSQTPLTALASSGNNAFTTGEDGVIRTWTLPLVASKNLPAHNAEITALNLNSDGNSIVTGGADGSLKLSSFSNAQLQKEFPGGTGVITSVAIPGGTLFAGSADGSLTTWNTADGKLLNRFPAHVGGVTAVLQQPNLPQVGTLGADGNLRLWQTPFLSSKSFLHPDKVNALSSTDGKKFFTGGADNIVRIWTTANTNPERQIPGHTGPVKAVVNAGEVIYSASADESIRGWNAADGKQTALLGGHTGPVNSLSIAGGLLVSGGNDGAVKFWQVPVTAGKTFAHPDGVTGLLLLPNGTRLLTLCGDKQARLWNLASGQADGTFALNGQAITALALAGDGTTFAIAGGDKSLTLRSREKELKKLPALAANATALGFSGDNTKVIAGLADGTLRILATADGKELKNLPSGVGIPSTILRHPKEDTLIIAGTQKTVILRNAADGAEKGKIDHTGPISAIAISKDAARIALGGKDKKISLKDLSGKPAPGDITTPAEVNGLNFSPDGLRLAVAGSDGRVRIYGIDGKLQESFTHEGAVTGVEFSPDGKRVFSVSADRTARNWPSAFLGQAFHVGAVSKVALLPNGDRLASVGVDGNLKIIDAKTFKEQKSYPAHTGAIPGLSLSADGAKIATGGVDKTVKIWNSADGKELLKIVLPGSATSVALSPNGLRVAASFAEGTGFRVAVFDTTSGKELQTALTSPQPIRDLKFLADNRTLASVGDDKNLTLSDTPVITVQTPHPTGVVSGFWMANGPLLSAGKDKKVTLWDVAGAKEVRSFAPVTGDVAAVTGSRDGTLIAAAAGKSVTIWQSADGKVLQTLEHPSEVTSVSFSPDRTKILTGAKDNLARVYDVVTGRFLQFVTHGAAVRQVAWHPNTTTLVTASADKTAVLNNVAILRAGVASTLPVRAMSMSPNQQSIAVVGDDKLLQFINPGNLVDIKKAEPAEAPLLSVAFSKNAAYVATSGADKLVRIYTTNDNKIIAPITAPAKILQLAFHPTLPILAGIGDDKNLHIWNVAHQQGQPTLPEFGRLIQSIPAPDALNGILFSETGMIYTAGNDGNIREWKAASDAPVKTFNHPNIVDCVAFDNTGGLLATGCHDGNVRVWDLEKSTLRKQIAAHTLPMPTSVYAIAWSSDSKQIVSGGFDHTAKLFDATSGNLVKEFKGYTLKTFEQGHRDQVLCLALSKDGKTLVTGSSDRTLKLWNTGDGNVVKEFVHPTLKRPSMLDPLPSHPGWVNAVKFTPDEKFIVAVGSAPKNQGYLSVWSVADGKLIYGAEVPFAAIHSLDISADGLLVLGCGPKNRREPLSEALLIPMPK